MLLQTNDKPLNYLFDADALWSLQASEHDWKFICDLVLGKTKTKHTG